MTVLPRQSPSLALVAVRWRTLFVTFSGTAALAVACPRWYPKSLGASPSGAALRRRLDRSCRRSTAVVQRFCKPKVGSSILSAGTSFPYPVMTWSFTVGLVATRRAGGPTGCPSLERPSSVARCASPEPGLLLNGFDRPSAARRSQEARHLEPAENPRLPTRLRGARRSQFHARGRTPSAAERCRQSQAWVIGSQGLELKPTRSRPPSGNMIRQDLRK